MTALALLALSSCEDDDAAPQFSDEVYCEIVESMDEKFCPDWRDEEDDYARGCYAAAFADFEESVGTTYPDFDDISPSPDTCLED